MTDSPEKKAQDTEGGLPGDGKSPDQSAIEASPFARCATCRNSKDIDVGQGTLLCDRFNMHINAEADEIPDDCPEYRRDPEKEPPPDPVDLPPASRSAGPDEAEDG